ESCYVTCWDRRDSWATSGSRSMRTHTRKPSTVMRAHGESATSQAGQSRTGRFPVSNSRSQVPRENPPTRFSEERPFRTSGEIPDGWIVSPSAQHVAVGTGLKIAAVDTEQLQVVVARLLECVAATVALVVGGHGLDGGAE